MELCFWDFFFLLTVCPDGTLQSFVRSELLIANRYHRIKALEERPDNCILILLDNNDFLVETLILYCIPR
ncbi:hypothetical protein B0I22_1724 [Epilithonimonas xixisoli]|uniref:Uncharacterized protein n=1 Tax=Epilithonimonas xixisoli TaxID=1476462 RepID=A0A4R8IFC4_9FLAO|nr:hypothetical protein B0I22_1724 [Epilithonimonas xixisoli]